jgi:hypothetical protein
MSPTNSSPVPKACGTSKSAHGRRTAVKGGAADPPPLNDRDLRAQLGGVKRSGDAGGTASNDDNAHLTCSSRTDAVMSTATSSLLVEHDRHLIGCHVLD